jgi:transmembrane sensor
MNDRNSSTVRHEIRREASMWFVELNENPQDQAVREEFDRWLRRSPEHLHAFLQVSVHWEETAPQPRASADSIDELIALAKADTNVVRLAERQTEISGASAVAASEAVRQSPKQTHASRRGRRAIAAAWAASILLAVGAGTVAWTQFFQGVYHTGIGEQLSVTLADGSTVELNSSSRIRVRYSSLARQVELLEGQALFHVAKGKPLPFVVQSGGTQVRAVGTRFDVYRKKTGTVVTVVEGRVAVTAAASATDVRSISPAAQRELAGATSPAVKFLDAGEQITVGPGDVATVPARLEAGGIDAATAWTQHRLVFKRAPLAEVVGEFNRYSTRKMIISDPAIAATEISGSFSSSDPEDLLRFLREVGAYDVRETASSIAISRK